MSIYRAYLTANGSLKSYVLTHDVKKALASQTGKSGLVNILSIGATTAVGLYESDPEVLTPLQQSVFANFQANIKPASPRRSGLSGAAYHQMAGFIGLAITIPFDRQLHTLKEKHERKRNTCQPQKNSVVCRQYACLTNLWATG